MSKILSGILIVVMMFTASCQVVKPEQDKTATKDVSAEIKKVAEFELDNGLKILVKEDHRAPIVTSQVWYRVGSSNEPPGLTGISHMLEHMMFKGTKKFPSGMARKIIAENGGEENAFTSRDHTVYYQNIEKSRLDICFELEADRMVNLLLDDKEFQKERLVVLEERRMRTDDRPNSKLYERFNAVAYLSNGYANPVIGWQHDIEGYTIDDLKQWYKKWYAPQNATLVVVGDVDPQAVYKLAKKYFGPIKGNPVKKLKKSVEIQPLGRKDLVVNAKARLPIMIAGYAVPSFTTAKDDWEPYALNILAGVLDSGAASRFTSRLVRGKELAAWIGVGYSTLARLDSQFSIWSSPAHGVDMETLIEAINAEITEIKEQMISPEELKRVKAQVMANAIYKLDSVSAQALEIGELETVGLGWEFKDKYYKKLQQITAEQVQTVARKYLIEDRLTFARLVPEKLVPEKMAPEKLAAEQSETEKGLQAKVNKKQSKEAK